MVYINILKKYKFQCTYPFYHNFKKHLYPQKYYKKKKI
jgi:hypothetical protein